MNQKQASLHQRWLSNVIGLVVCWFSLWLGFTVLYLFNSLVIGIQLIAITPLYYFLFDLHPLHNQVRTGTFNKVKVITALTKYLHRKFNMFWGNFIADLVGILYAMWQMTLNGFCLLFLDTFLWRCQHDPEEILLQQKGQIKTRYVEAIEEYGQRDFETFIEQEVNLLESPREKDLLRKNLTFLRFQYIKRLNTANKFTSVERYYKPTDTELKLTDSMLINAQKKGNRGES
ncbi:hypothetical protein [Lactiplantibacillus plantarum]|uniref:hypothetical protein n=1 Tax=Lactiplantibacillus plantarum TaxID=1590 RepID=UPI001BA84963|nr:hypothetical protein [Lactiplantibacillus plantarum]MBS0956702.1 hypothetical protein [Lactiplantibacillus plantarum]